jgi:hypothetical protein
MELGGREIICPHCSETILLPLSKSAAPWIVTGIFAFITVCLALVLIFQHQNRRDNIPAALSDEHRNDQSGTTQNQNPVSVGEESERPEDKAAIAKLCQEFYDALNNNDDNAVYGLVAASCQKVLTLQDMKKLHDRFKYQFVGVDSVKYQTSALGLAAMAKVKRTVLDGAGAQQGWHSFKFVKEPNGWRFFRDEEVMSKIVSDFKGSFTDKIVASVQLLRDGDPFDIWNNNDTNDFETIFKLSEGQPGVFPWNFEFNVVTNNMAEYSLSVVYSIRNKSSSAWVDLPLDFDLKLNGNVISSREGQLLNISSGNEIVRTVSFFLAHEPQETARYFMDVRHSFGISLESFPVAQDIPVDIRVKKASDMAKLEITGTQFESSLSDNFQDMLSARINYRVRNVSTEPIEALDIKCVWFAQTGEQIDQSTEYVVGFGDVPLGAGQFKTGFIRCGVGYRNVRVPVKVDIYLESGEKRSLAFKGLLVR